MVKTKIWKSKDGWRWRFVEKGGRVLADSGQVYLDRIEAEQSLARLIKAVLTIACDAINSDLKRVKQRK